MPLIVLTGIPSSGKTVRTKAIQEYFEKTGKSVVVISEIEAIRNAGFTKNQVYADANKEKHIRSLLKSQVGKYLNQQTLVILDGLNYIKGYRYELFCLSKNQSTTQCTIYTIINNETAWQYNENRCEDERYSREIFDNLRQRYEEPNGNNRWDSPLIQIFNDQQLDMDEIDDCLFKRKSLKPNKSTQNLPLSSTNYLYDLDQITKRIVDNLINLKQSNINGRIKIDNYDNLYLDITNASVQQLINLRRQYLSFSKLNPPKQQQQHQQQLAKLFVDYLNTNLNHIN